MVNFLWNCHTSLGWKICPDPRWHSTVVWLRLGIRNPSVQCIAIWPHQQPPLQSDHIGVVQDISADWCWGTISFITQLRNFILRKIFLWYILSTKSRTQLRVTQWRALLIISVRTEPAPSGVCTVQRVYSFTYLYGISPLPILAEICWSSQSTVRASQL